MASPPPLVLASGSPYRAAQLRRLQVPFEQAASGADETRLQSESPETMVRRLARAKAAAVAATRPEALVIGGDQVAVLGDEILGKPRTRVAAIEQIERQAGREVVFLSALALHGCERDRCTVVETRLKFRALERAEIERYLDLDQPYDCAGAMRSESAGISLLESLTSDDPSALIGLPLIRLAAWLREAGYQVP